MAERLKIKNKRGFTLIEVITVLLVVSLGMIGVLSLIVQNIQSQSLNKNTLIAYQLAQEGTELIRQVRDSNWRAEPPRPWRTNLANGTYYMDYTDTAPHEATADSSGRLKKDAEGMYISDPNAAAKPDTFTRIIIIEDQEPEPGILVTTKVFWQDHGRNYVYLLETLLYDWL